MDRFVDFGFSLLGWSHLLACLLAMASFFPVMVARKGSRSHRSWGRVYAIAYALLCITSLGIYRQQKFWFPHWLAIGGLVVLGAGFLAVRFKPAGWRYVHVLGMLLSALNLFGGAINEFFLRVKPLNAMVGSNLDSPIVGILQGLNWQTFIILITVYLTWTASRNRTR